VSFRTIEFVQSVKPYGSSDYEEYWKRLSLFFRNNSDLVVEFDFVMAAPPGVPYVDSHQPHTGHVKLYPKQEVFAFQLQDGSEGNYSGATDGNGNYSLSFANINPPLSEIPVPPTPTPIEIKWPDGRKLLHPDQFVKVPVVNVDTNDTLKLRSGPGTSFTIIGAIPANETEITAFSEDQVWDGDTWWCPVEWRGIRGYVGRSHLPK
jgi:Bacterial SH3 domain